jgi:uncharacterized protein
MQLEVEGVATDLAGWNGRLYRPLTHQDFKPCQLRAIPYFLWANRSPAAMRIWLPTQGD